MKKNTLLVILMIAAVGMLSGCNKKDIKWFPGHHGGGDGSPSTIPLSWYKLQTRILLERNSAMNAAYFAYIGIGLYEAVRHDSKKAGSFSGKLYQMPAMPALQSNKDYDWQVSANAAMASMVRSFYTGLTPANLFSIDSLEDLFNQNLKSYVNPSTFNRSREYGRSIAAAIFSWSATDNYNPSNAGYVPPIFPGSWTPTPPAFAGGVMPYVSAARPLLQIDGSSVAPAPPVPYSETTGSDFYKMVRDVYDISLILTEEQKNIALFWVDQGNGIGYTPHGHDFSIVTQALEVKGTGLVETAEVYAKAGIAERESVIICFRSKYKYNLVRPVTYVQKFINPGWLPLIVTPPHPEYPAAHAFVTGSVMQVTAKLLGENLKVTDHSYDFRGWTPRTYNGLFKAGEEAGMSRFYGGIHYLPSIHTGLALAKDLGDRIQNIDLTH